MVHYDKIIETTCKLIEEKWKSERQAKAYIVQNVYGRISVYLDTDKRELAGELKAELQKKIDIWMNECELLKDNYFAEMEVLKWEKNYRPTSDRIWIVEKFLTNTYWNSDVVRQKNNSLNSKLISFYSFKGGVGRTTTMIMSAIDLAKRGKKIVLIDFDLEAPGVASLFPDEEISKYGVLDFLIESASYEEKINIDEYLYTVSDYCHVSQDGGAIYVVPALGQVCRENVELYRKNLMRFDLNVPAYTEKHTPIDTLLEKVDAFLEPDYILIDTRSGLHQMGGITLARYSDMAVLFFYGSQQNAEGMKMVLPVLKQCGVPFTLVNSKVPANEEVAAVEKKIFLEGSHSALASCDEQYREGLILIDDDTAEHYPIDISYSDALEVIGSTEQLMKAYEQRKANYRELVNVLEENFAEDTQGGSTKGESAEVQIEIVKTFSSIMNGLETAAAEDEFSTSESLSENFYPLKAYTFIFDTRKFLVLAQKGMGKTALFSALKNNEYAKELAKYLKVDSEQYEHTEWVVGTSQSTNWAEIFGCLETEDQIRAFLYFKTIKILFENDASLTVLLESNSNVKELFSQEMNTSQNYKLAKENVYYLEKLMLEINDHLSRENRIVTIIYDALDRVVYQKDRAKFNSALIEMWYRHENTMKNLRSKIFLRKDIYDREVEVADKVKLKNYSVTLAWEYDQLFAMVWKRAVCKSAVIKKFYEEKTLQNIHEIEGLSYIPVIDEASNRALLTALIGVKMGSSKKASTYNWFKNRLSDTQGIIVPRSMLDIFAKAATRELELRLESPEMPLKSIIRPKCLEESLGAVSEKRVIDLKEEFREYAAFLDGLKDTVQRSPVEEERLKNALSEAGLENPGNEIRNLINIGILRKYQRRLSDPVRYHFPDIYLRGLGLQRSGMK